MLEHTIGTLDGPAPIVAATPTAIRVVGLDLSLTGFGVVVIDDGGIHPHLIKSTGKRTDTLRQRAHRLSTLSSQIIGLIPERALVVIEQPAYSKTNGSHHDRSGLWWLIVDTIASFQSVVEVTPGTLKKYATGSGTASKDAMLAAAIRRYPHVPIDDNNVADAMHLAAMGSRHLGYPLEPDTVKIAEAMLKPGWTE